MSKQKMVTKKEEKPQDRVFVFSKKELKQKLYEFMKLHIGREKGVGKNKIFTILFGSPDGYSDLEVFYLWQQAKQLMNQMRRQTKMFVVGKKSATSDAWSYYVVQSEADGAPYIALLKELKQRQDFMVNRCQKAIKEKWSDSL